MTTFPEGVSATTGFAPKVLIQFDQESLVIAPYFKKVALHELGHAQGLADFPFGRTFRPTVMRGNAPTFQDLGGYISEVVTECDRKMVRQALLGSLPRP